MSEVPLDHFWYCQNIAYRRGRFGIRPGSSLYYNIGRAVGDVAEWVTGTYPASLLSIDSNGNFYLNNSGTVLYNVPGATDFFSVNFYSALFIVPCNAAGPIGNLLMLYYPQSTVAITGVSVAGNNATYSYNLVYGPALQVGQQITIEEMTNPGNNIGPAPITALGAGTFTIVNPQAIAETDGIWVGDTFQVFGVGTGINNNNPTIKQCGGMPPTAASAMIAVDGNAQVIATAVYGPNACSIEAQTGSNASWSNMAGLQNDAGNPATCAMSAGGSSNTLTLTGFNFGIPSTDVVEGVVVTIHRQQGAGTSAAYDSNISLTAGGNNYYNPNPWSGNTYEVYGSATDTWGLGNGLTPAVVNSSTFGVNITLDCTGAPGNGATADIFYVTITIYTQSTITGNVPAGQYQINIVYETDTGFITPPSDSPNVAITFNAAGSHQMELTNVPIGPSGTVNRQIIITMPGTTEPFFFVPGTNGGVINDNATTTATLDFFETDLVDSADDQFDILASIPSGQGINLYNARLILWGMPYPNNSILNCSGAGTPETFNQTLMTYIVNKDDGYPVTNTLIDRAGTLFVFKSKGIFSVIDNGQDPVNWDTATPVDQSLGTSFRGISTATPVAESSTQQDLSAFADPSGLYIFNGQVVNPPISWKVQDLWNSITSFAGIRICIDVINKRIHVTGFDANSQMYNMALVGDFNEGIDWESIKWDLWTYHNNVRIFDNASGTGAVLCTLLSTGIIVTFNTNLQTDYVSPGVTSPIVQSVITAGIDFNAGGISDFFGIRTKCVGIGDLNITLYSEDQQSSYVPAVTPILSPTPGMEYTIKTNFRNEKCYYNFTNDPTTPSSYFSMSKAVFYGNPYSEVRPS
jgi:hypothetical protein